MADNIKSEDVAKNETLKTETAKTEAAKPAAEKAEAAKNDAVKNGAEKAEAAKSEAAKSGTEKAEAAKTEVKKAEVKKPEAAPKYRVSSNPHVRSKSTTQSIMLTVIIALLPAAGFGIFNFGIRALWIELISVASAVLTEFLFNLILKKKQTILDLSAVVTGLLLALNLPVNVPLWMPVLGSAFAILVVKMFFGGIGQNFMNPALAGRCFLLISFPVAMTNFATDAYTGATPLALLKTGDYADLNIMHMIFGTTSGTIGETSMIAIVIGAVILILTGVIDLKIPGSYILSFVVFILIFGGHGIDIAYVVAELAGGGLMLGAFFMATDYTTRPITDWGQIVYGIFLGILTGIFRIFGPGAEGVSYAIIIGNLIVPLIEKITRPVPFGFTRSSFKEYVKGGKK